MVDSVHVHTIANTYEGPLWFCACGAEFFPGKKTPLSDLDIDARRERSEYLARTKTVRQFMRRHGIHVTP